MILTQLSTQYNPTLQPPMIRVAMHRNASGEHAGGEQADDGAVGQRVIAGE